MKRLRVFCMVLLIASAITCAGVLYKTSKPITFEEALKAEYGVDTYQNVYSTVQAEIANYIVQYGFLTDSWVIEEQPKFSDDIMKLHAKLKDGTVLNVTYYNDTGECDVETNNTNDISSDTEL